MRIFYILPALFCLTACVVPTGEEASFYASIEVEGETYDIEAQEHEQTETLYRGPGLNNPTFDLYFVRVNGRRVECGTHAGADRATILAACRARIEDLLEDDDDNDDDGGYRVPDY